MVSAAMEADRTVLRSHGELHDVPVLVREISDSATTAERHPQPV
jgi:hypothetical protein